jgi:hypothetical protein
LVHKIEDVAREEIEVSIIPKLKPCNEISLGEGDTLVGVVDSEKWDIDDAQQFYKLLNQAFPNNNILMIFDGIELGVIKSE